MDLRTPIGLLFTAVGLLLALFGAAHGSAAYLETGLNIDLIWGLVLLVFGLGMLLLAWRGARRERRAAAAAPPSVASEKLV